MTETCTASDGAPGAAPAHVTILLVEDNPGDTALISETLASFSDVHIVGVESGEAALANMGIDIDLVLLDHGLPGISGFEVLRQMRESYPQIPVVMLTGRDDGATVRAALLAGAADFVAKSELASADSENSMWRTLGRVLRTRDAATFRDDLLSVVAHDLRAPLANVIGFAGAMRDGIRGPVSPELKRDILRILSNATSMLQLVDGLMQALESTGRVKRPRRRPVRVAELMDAALERNGFVASVKEVTWQRVYPERQMEVELDAEALGRALDNLIGNAVKFSPVRSVITVGCEIGVSEASFFVSDQGPGVPAEVRARLFGRSRRESAPGTGGEKGHGLGLYIVDCIARQLGGHVRLSSGPSGGTTFTLVVPCEGKASP